MNHKTTGIIAAVFAAGIATGLLGAILFIPNGRSEVARISSTEPTGAITHVTDATSTYRNTTYGFALDYPSELAVDEYDEGDGDRTIVFRKGAEDFGFQIFLTPYASETISLDDLQHEAPWMQIENAETTSVGSGTPALAFASKAPGMDASRELWFVHRGYLFEVTTYPELADWLTDIFRTWQFTN